MAHRKKIEDVMRPVVGQFYPLGVLWEGNFPGLRFPSEGAARWFIRGNRDALVRAKALVLDSGRWLVNPERFAKVREDEAGARAENRVAGSAA